MSTKIYFYKTTSGKEVILDFINDLNPGLIIKVRNAIRIFEECGLALLSTKLVKKVSKTPPVFELRITGSQQIRLLFSEVKPNIFLFTNIFIKKSQKTPIKEIKTSIHRLNEFI